MNIRFYQILVAVFLTSHAFGQELKLILLSPSQTFVVGEKIQMQLVIDRLKPDSLIKTTDVDVESKNKFVYDFEVVPKKVGKKTLGPYDLVIGGKKLVSNTIDVTIIDPSANGNKLTVKCEGKAEVNKKFVMELISFKVPLKDITLKAKPSIIIGPSSNASNTAIENGQRRFQSTVTFELTFIEKGVFQIDDTWFEHVPDTYSIASKTVEVQ